MSVGQDFDRSILERKDRADLLAIAEALGAKASAVRRRPTSSTPSSLAAGHADDGAADGEPRPARRPARSPRPGRGRRRGRAAGADGRRRMPLTRRRPSTATAERTPRDRDRSAAERSWCAVER